MSRSTNTPRGSAGESQALSFEAHLCFCSPATCHGSRTPLLEYARQHSEPLALLLLPCAALALHRPSAFPAPSLPLLHLTTWNVLFHQSSLVHPSRPFSMPLAPKSFADISSYPGPALWNLADLNPNSFMEPTFFKFICCCCLCVHACSLICRHVYVFIFMCLPVH